MKRKRVNSTTSVKSEKSDRARTRSMDKGEDEAETSKAPAKKAEPILFKRIDESKYQDIASHFRDNTFEAKAKFG